MVSITINH